MTTDQKFSLERDDPEMSTALQFAATKAFFPEWFAVFERLDPAVCTAGDLEMLELTSPRPFMSGFLYAWRAARVQLDWLAHNSKA